jgi:hypothetical protein
MKAIMTAEIAQQLSDYDWDIDGAKDLVCGEFLFMYGEFDSVEVTEVTRGHIKFTFHNEFAGDITLQIDRTCTILEVR